MSREFVLFYLLTLDSFIFLLYVYMCFTGMYVLVPCVCSALGSQKRALYPLELELQRVVSGPPCGCWEPNLGPLEKQLQSYLSSPM